MSAKPTVWVNTHRVTLAEFESDVAYPIEADACQAGVPRPDPRPKTWAIAIVLAVVFWCLVFAGFLAAGYAWGSK
jgi:hypothetical protein